jgi:hypothetical protein
MVLASVRGLVAACWQQPLLQDDVARWLGTREVGTPSDYTYATLRVPAKVTDSE